LPGKILVTGATGFVGSYIIKDLIQHGYQVRALRRSNRLPFWIEKSMLDKVEWVDGDILDIVSLEDAMDGIDTVIHAAAVVAFVKKDRAKMYQVNVDGTANVVDSMLEKNINRLVYISSVAALGRTNSGGHVTEEKKWEESSVNTHYAISKYKAELQVWRAIGEGLNAVILNPSTVLGFGDWDHGSCAIFKNIYEGIGFYTSGVNGFVDVEDLADVTRRMMESGTSEQRFIVNGHTWPFRQLQETIADGFNKKRPTREATPFLLGLAWRMERFKSMFTGNRPLLTKESARVGITRTWFENDKLLKALPGFSFRPLEETIKKACEKYADRVNSLQPK
jgi:dihydroflavonol-4-reductase